MRKTHDKMIFNSNVSIFFSYLNSYELNPKNQKSTRKKCFHIIFNIII